MHVALSCKQGGGVATAMTERLTPGEMECLDLVAKGMVSKEIARALDISPHTVDARLRTAARKLGARNRFVAAQLYAEKHKDVDFTEFSNTSNLIYEDLNLPPDPAADKMELSPTEGNGAGDVQSPAPILEALPPRGELKGWLNPSHPFAKFFGGENRLGIGRRTLLIIFISIGTAMAFTAVVNSLIGLSRLISPP